MKVALVLALLSGAGMARAQFTWIGTGNITLGVTDSNNWVGNVTPTSGGDVLFGLSAPPTVNIPTSIIVGNITFNDTTPTPRPDYSFFGQNSAKLTIGGNITVNSGGGAGGNGNVTINSSLPFVLTNGAHTANITTGSILAIGSNISQSIDAVARIVKVGGGTLTLTGTNTYSGTTTISEGTISANKIVVSGGASSLGNASSAVVLGDATHTGTLIYTGTTASYTRGFTVSAGGGEVDVTTSGQTLTIATGGVVAGGAFTIGGLGSTTISSVISGAGSLNKTGTGTLTLSGANTYAGATTIGTANGVSAGTLTLGGSNVLPNTTVNLYTGTLNINSRTETIGALNLGGGAGGTTASVTGTTGTLTLGGGVTYNATNNPAGATISANLSLGASRTFTVGDSTPAADLTISSIIDDGGSTFSLTKAGAGTLVLTGANSYDGGTTISAGTLQLGNGGATGALSSSGSIVINGGTLGTGTLVVDRSSDITLSNAISGSGNLTKLADNTLTLSGTNTNFSGPLTAASGNGSVEIASLNARGTGPWSFAGNTTLDITTIGTNSTTGVLRTAATTNFTDTARLLAENSFAISSGTQNFTGAAVLTASAANVITGGNQNFTAATISALPGNVAFSIGNFTALTDTQVGTLLDSTAHLTVDKVSTSSTITGGTQTFNGYASLQANHAGSLAAGSTQIFNDNSHLRLGRSVQNNGSAGGQVITGGTQTFNNSSFLWAKTVDGGSGVSGGDQAFHNSSSFVAAMASAVTGGNQTFDFTSSLYASVMGAIAGGNQSFSGNSTFFAAAEHSITGGNQTFTGNSSLVATANNTIVGGNQTFTGSAGIYANAANSLSGLTLTLRDTSFIRAGAANSLSSTTNIYFSGLNNGAGGSLILNGNNTTVGKISSGNPVNQTPGTIENASATPAKLTVTIPGEQTSIYTGIVRDQASVGGGALSLDQAGSGTLELSGVGTFSGNTTISGTGGIMIGNPLALSGSTLNHVTGCSTVSFATNISSATLGSLAGSGDIVLQYYSSSNENLRPVALTVGANGQNTTYSGVLSEPTFPGASLTKTGNGTLTLTGNNTFTGTTTVTSGTLNLGNGGKSGGVSGNISNSGTVVHNRSDDVTYGGVLSGSGAFIKQGTGNLTLTGHSNFTGNATLAAGTLLIGAINALPTSTQISIQTGSTLDVANDQTIAGFFGNSIGGAILLASTLTVDMPVANTFTNFDGAVNGTGNFTATGQGGDIVHLATGAVAGTVTLSAGSGAQIVIGNGPIALTNPLNFSSNTSQTLNNVISGNGSIVVSGGVTTLTATSNYTGPTTVNGGKLIVNGAVTGTGLFTVSNGGILGGSGSIAGNLVLNPGSTLAPGNSPGALAAGSTTWTGGATFAFDINSTTGTPGTNWDLLNITGGLTITSTAPTNPFIISLNSLTAGNAPGMLAGFSSSTPYSWQFVTTTTGITGFSSAVFSFNTTNFQNSLGVGSFFVTQSGNNLLLNFTPVPEPSTWALLATGVGALALATRRRRQ